MTLNTGQFANAVLCWQMCDKFLCKDFYLKKYTFPFWVSLKMPTLDTFPLLIPEKTSALIFDYLYIIILFN